MFGMGNATSVNSTDADDMYNGIDPRSATIPGYAVVIATAALSSPLARKSLDWMVDGSVEIFKKAFQKMPTPALRKFCSGLVGGILMSQDVSATREDRVKKITHFLDSIRTTSDGGVFDMIYTIQCIPSQHLSSSCTRLVVTEHVQPLDPKAKKVVKKMRPSHIAHTTVNQAKEPRFEIQQHAAGCLPKGRDLALNGLFPSVLAVLSNRGRVPEITLHRLDGAPIQKAWCSIRIQNLYLPEPAGDASKVTGGISALHCSENVQAAMHEPVGRNF